jgi:hypothetical protein
VVVVSIVFGGCAIAMIQWAKQEKMIWDSETLKQQVIIESRQASACFASQAFALEAYIRSGKASDLDDFEKSAYAFRESLSQVEKRIDLYYYYTHLNHGEYQRWLKDIRSYYDIYFKLSNIYPPALAELRVERETISEVSSKIKLVISEFRAVLEKEFASVVSASTPKTSSNQTTSTELQTGYVNYSAPSPQPTIDFRQIGRIHNRISDLGQAELEINAACGLLMRATPEDRNIIEEALNSLNGSQRLLEGLKNDSVRADELNMAKNILEMVQLLERIVQETGDRKRQLPDMERETKAVRDRLIQSFDEMVRRLETQKPENEKIKDLVMSNSSMLVSVSILGLAFLGSLAVILWAGLGGNRQSDLKIGNEFSKATPQVETDLVVQTALDLLIGQLRAMAASLESIRRRITGQ